MIGLDNDDKNNRIKTERKNCYTCGILLALGEDYKKGNNKTDIRYFCKKDFNYKQQKARKIIVLIKR